MYILFYTLLYKFWPKYLTVYLHFSLYLYYCCCLYCFLQRSREMHWVNMKLLTIHKTLLNTQSPLKVWADVSAFNMGAQKRFILYDVQYKQNSNAGLSNTQLLLIFHSFNNHQGMWRHRLVKEPLHLSSYF